MTSRDMLDVALSELVRRIDDVRDGNTNAAEIESSLREHLIEHPEAAPAFETELNVLLAEGVLPGALHASLTAMMQNTRHSASSGTELPTGTVIRERFVLEDVIGRGGMSVVYRARDRRREEAQDRNSLVAIKVLGGKFKDHPDAFVALQREARRAQQLAHPNIATVYDFDREGDTPFLCMELLTGRSLHEVLRAPAKLPTADAMHIISGMANGLAYAHASGIVHADFKPGNVFVTDDNEVKVLDFGIARVIPDDSASPATVFDAGRLGALTPGYASCEMFEHRTPDPRDDVYGLACVSYELLSGEHPFDRTPATEARAQGMTPAAIAGLSRSQNRALRQGMAFDRESRTASAQEFSDALTAQSGMAKGVAARNVGALPLAVVTVAVVVVAVVAAVMFWRVDDNADPEPPKAAVEMPVDVGSNGLPATEANPATPNEGRTPAPVTEAVREKIERILFIADLHLQVEKYVEPPGTNAAEAYAEALKLQPGNLQALAGLAAVGDALLEKATTSDQLGDREEALELVSQGLRYLPDHEGLLELATKLDSEREGFPNRELSSELNNALDDRQ